MREDNKALTRRYFEETDRGRTPTELFAPDFTAHFPGPPAMDSEAFADFGAMFRSAFSNLRHQLEDLLAEHDSAAVRLVLEGTHTGEFMALRASGKHFAIDGTAFLRIQEGKIVELWGALDQVALMRQIGEQPPAA
jgi:predicted ester cyclase